MPRRLLRLGPFCDAFNGAAVFGRHLVQIQVESVFDDSPFSAIFMV
jgi:hypothetical protein